MAEPSSVSFLTRTVKSVKSVWHDIAGSMKSRDYGTTLADGSLSELEEQMRECLYGAGGEVSARQRAASLGEVYLDLEIEGRAKFLKLIATKFAPNDAAIEAAIAEYSKANEAGKAEGALDKLRNAVKAPRIELLTRFNAIPQGVKFLVDMRADLQGIKGKDPALNAMDRELRSKLTSWFDIGFLDLQRITWNSPASLLEKLIAYESVHEIASWDDLRNRLDSDRRLYAFFHPRMPTEPLIFVEVALVKGIADNVQALLDEDAPIMNARKADTAIFYSISNTQVGLRGISFGNFLIKRVAASLNADLPNVKNFCTLSPIPGLSAWIEKLPSSNKALPNDLDKGLRFKKATGEIFDLDIFKKLKENDDWFEDQRFCDALKAPLTKLAAHYLVNEKSRSAALDPVARFHLGNGARIEQLNWRGDSSERGIEQSYGLMVNYLYRLGDIEKNHELLAEKGEIAISSNIKALL